MAIHSFNQGAHEMTDPKVSPVLAKLAEIFRNKGDQVTAEALDRQVQSTGTQNMNAENLESLRRLCHKASRLDNAAAHDEAEPLLVEALRVVESILGPNHLDIADHLNALARCRLNNGDFEAALKSYARLLWLMGETYGPDDMLTKITLDSVQRCQGGLRDAVGTLCLEGRMAAMLRQ